MARTRLIQAIHDGIVEEMARDPKVIVYGEDVELSIVGDLRGVHEQFGHDRIRNTPICETTLTGMAVGLASAGYRVVVQMMFSNFLYTGMDAIGARYPTVSTSSRSARRPCAAKATPSPWWPLGGWSSRRSPRRPRWRMRA